jgi:hypothetical protein
MAILQVDDDFVAGVAKGRLSLDDLRRDVMQRAAALAESEKKRAMTELIARTQDAKERGRVGRLCALIVIGAVAFPDKFVEKVNSSGLLVVRDAMPRFDRTTVEWIGRLGRSSEAPFDVLRERFETYRALYNARLGAANSGQSALEVLRQRPFRYGKTLLALADIAFLRAYYGLEAGLQLRNIYRDLEEPEKVAAAVSACLAIACEAAALNSMDFTYPMSGLYVTPECEVLIRYGHLIATLAEFEKMVAIGYKLVQQRIHDRDVFSLLAPSIEVEYSLRLGFVRREVGSTAAPLHVVDEGGASLVSIQHAAEVAIARTGNMLFDVADADQPFRRLRLLVPQIPRLLREMSRWRFYEDALWQEQLAQELELPMRLKSEESWQVAPGLGLQTFLRTWKVLVFLNTVHIVLVRQHQDDEVMVRNSLIRIMKLEDWRGLLQATGLSAPQCDAFLKLVSIDLAAPGFVDIQYRPLLMLNGATFTVGGQQITAPAEIVHSAAVVATANVLPNIQRSHGIRVDTNAQAFVELAETVLRRVFARTKTNVPVKGQAGRTDVDIVALTNDVLYLFECKHSIPPTGAHELRDPWMDVKKGVAQLERATEILREKGPDAYVLNWFPGVKAADARKLKVRCCVLCSHRVFSGLEIRGIPVRDLLSLNLVLGDAKVFKGQTGRDEGVVDVTPYRLRAAEDATVADLDDYLGADSRYFSMFRPFMRRICRIEFRSASLVLTRESFVYQVTEGEWERHLESLGAQRLPGEAVVTGPAKPAL